MQRLKKMNVPILVVDYNPKVIFSLEKQGISCVFGDAADKNFLAEIELGKAKLVISTIPEEEANLAIRETLNELKSRATFIATAEQPRQALDLYEKGIDYVVIPHHLGGDFVSHLIEHYGTSHEKFKHLGKEHYVELKKARDGSSYN